MAETLVRPLAAGDAARWRELFRAYGVFYETEFSDEVLDRVWALLLETDSGIDGLAVEGGGGGGRRGGGRARRADRGDRALAFASGYLLRRPRLVPRRPLRRPGHARNGCRARAHRAPRGDGGGHRRFAAVDHRRHQRDRAGALRPRRDAHPLGHLRDEALMQLGTRWNVGGEVPPRVPDPVVAAIREV